MKADSEFSCTVASYASQLLHSVNTDSLQSFGKHAETIIAQALQQSGCTLLAQNYSTRQGEIDIIAAYNNTILFIEVKARIYNMFDIGTVITPHKQHKMIQTARHFLHYNNHLLNNACRFDVALIEQIKPYPHITYITDAFQESS